jgi:hypothetical protein
MTGQSAPINRETLEPRRRAKRSVESARARSMRRIIRTGDFVIREETWIRVQIWLQMGCGDGTWQRRTRRGLG